jgi:hypothetical protein
MDWLTFAAGASLAGAAGFLPFSQDGRFHAKSNVASNNVALVSNRLLFILGTRFITGLKI